MLQLSALGVLAAAAFAAWHFKADLDPQVLRSDLAHTSWAPLIFVAAHVVVSLAFFPRMAVAVAAGLIFGLWWGILWALVGAMAGAWAGFGLARLIGRDAFRMIRLDRLHRLIGRLDRGGWRAVLMIRLLPIMPHTPINYALGLTDIGWPAYSVGSLIGIVPSTIWAVSFGAAGATAASGDGIGWLVPFAIGGVALGVSLALPAILRRWRNAP